MTIKKLLIALCLFVNIDLFAQAPMIELDLATSPSPINESQSQLRVQLKNTSGDSLFLPPSTMSLAVDGKTVGYHFSLDQQEQYALKEISFWQNQLEALADRPAEEASRFAQLRLNQYVKNPLAEYTQLCRVNLSLAQKQLSSIKLYLETYRLAAGEQLIFYMYINSLKQAKLEYSISINGKIHKSTI
jgi:hypothetical protein